MHKMYSNLAKTHAFPLASTVCLKPRCFKQFCNLKSQSLPIGSHPKPHLNPTCFHFSTLSHGFDRKSLKVFNFQCKHSQKGGVARAKSVLGGFRLKGGVHCWSVLRARGFSSSNSMRVGEGAGKSLPWLSSNKLKEAKSLGKGASKNGGSSWEQSVKRLEKVDSGSSSSWEDSAKRLEKGIVIKTAQSSWEDSAEAVAGKSNSYMVGNKESRNRVVGGVRDMENGNGNNGRNEIVEEGGEEELEVVDDPRWDKIKNRFRGMMNVKEKPEFQRWNKQENWGRKTWKEATESTIPKVVGEGVYGVGPVLAALSAGRREFYALYIQEGLDLSGNNKKKKDKKGFEKVLRMAQKIGLSTKEISKHDLNMVVDNRPHQGLVLDASPLEMVKIKELDPVLPGEEKGSVWVALDEVTDPQNLGAIIRSAYFFGASGVVLCAKNSAPLSGVVSKASAGSLELMELRYCKNMMQFLVSSAENGWRVLGGSVASKAVPLNKVLPGEPTILVLGSEGTGLRPLVERSCTQLVRIPGNIPVDVSVGGDDEVEAEESKLKSSSEEFRSFLAVESLNVSVAAGVLLHHLTGNNHNDCCMDDSSTDVLE